MKLPRGLRIIAPGAILIGATGLLSLWIKFPAIRTSPDWQALIFGGVITVLSPFVLIFGELWAWLSSNHEYPDYLVAIAVIALWGTPCHLLSSRRWAAIATG